MKFLVSRASLRSRSQQPCDEAVKIAVVGGNIPGRPASEEWAVELPSLDALMAFARAHDEDVIVSHSNLFKWRTPEGVELPSIQIYDDYIE